MKNKILSTVIILIVEIVLVVGMLLLPIPMPTRVRVLDSCVLSVLWLLFSYDLFNPLLKIESKNAPEYGSLGIRWSLQIFYAVTSIAVIVAGIAVPLEFFYQLLGQVFLFGTLLSAFVWSRKAGQQVTKVAAQQEKVLSGRQQMKDAIGDIQDKIAIANYPSSFCVSVKEIEDKLRYIAPSDNPGAIKLENQFVEIAQKISIAMANYAMNEDNIKQDLLRLHRILENRKNICE